MIIEHSQCLLTLHVPIDHGVVKGRRQGIAAIGGQDDVLDEAAVPAELGLYRSNAEPHQRRYHQRAGPDKSLEAPFRHSAINERSLSLRRCGSALRSAFGRTRGTPPLLLIDPEPMMLARPVQVYLAASHSGEGSLHANGSDVDVAQNDGDHHQGDDTMPEGAELHFHHWRDSQWNVQTQVAEKAESARPQIHLEGEHQRDPGKNQGETAEDHQPEENLLSRIELACGYMRVATENAAPLQEPDDVMPVRDVVSDPENEHQQQAESKG